jgi:hypothetical protein
LAPQVLPLIGGELKGEVGRKALGVSLHRSHERLRRDAVQRGEVGIEHDASFANDEDPLPDTFPDDRVRRFS